ncbi:MAG: hypothetical protein JST48_04140 [Bacteroidetes bacterium]|nr:hypothetical protein [Bacteroidota bacterium]
MSVRREIPECEGIYFITITCSSWLHLFDIADAYDEVYNWFDHLKKNGHFILGYVIMPNHLHALLGFRNTRGVSINSMVGEGKRFISYGIVKRLKVKGEHELLADLYEKVNNTDKRKGKKHGIFEASFDWKECRSDKFIDQKLEYIHANPCRGIWNLAKEEYEYKHSSSNYYQTGKQGVYAVTNYTELEDIDLTKAN